MGHKPYRQTSIVVKYRLGWWLITRLGFCRSEPERSVGESAAGGSAARLEAIFLTPCADY